MLNSTAQKNGSSHDIERTCMAERPRSTGTSIPQPAALQHAVGEESCPSSETELTVKVVTEIRNVVASSTTGPEAPGRDNVYML